MGTVSLSLPSDGETIDSSDYNTPITTFVNEFNGEIDNANIASDAAISGSKLADGSVTSSQTYVSTIFATATPGGNSDSTGSYADWGASVSITVPTWANRAIVTATIEGYFIVTSATTGTTRVVIGSDTGATSGTLGANAASPNDSRAWTWSDQITLTGTGSVTLKNQIVETGGSGAIRVTTASKFAWVIHFYAV